MKELKARHDDDFCDRLSRSYTTALLIMCAMIVTTKQFVGDPITCWCPAQFTESHRQYANTVCWVSNTYYIPMDIRVPNDFNNDRWRHKQKVSYYQWVPLVLLCMALGAYVPCLLWRFLVLRSGIDVSSVVESAAVCQRASYAEIREKTIRYIVNQMDRHLLSQRDHGQGCCSQCKKMFSRYCFFVGGKRHGNYLMVAYLIIKLLYLANAVGQLFLLDNFLGIDYHLYGVHIIARMLKGVDWTEMERFPRVTLCNFDIRHQARVHNYVVQCALTINLFNEKIFIIIWFWYVFIAIMTFVSAVQWLCRALYWPAQVQYVKRKLRAFEVTHRPKASLRKFVQYYLRRDGLFIIRLMSQNISELVAAEALAGLWENYGPDRRLLAEHPEASPRTVISRANARVGGGIYASTTTTTTTTAQQHHQQQGGNMDIV